MPNITDINQNFLKTSEGELYYWTAGDGPNIVLVHQSSNSSEEYKGLVPFLADKFRLICLDLPGHGRSTDPVEEPSVRSYSQAVLSVMDHLDIERTHIVGHHGGSLIAVNLLAEQPDRFDKAVLSGTGGIKTPEAAKAFKAAIMKTDTRIRAEADFVADAWKRYVSMMSDGAELRDIMKPYIAFLDARLRPHRAILANLKWDRREAMSKLKGPVLLLQGENDFYIKGQESLLAIIPQSRRQIIKGGGPFVFYDRPETCAKIVSAYLMEV